MVVPPVGLVQLHTCWWVVAHLAVVAGCVERWMLVGLDQPVAKHMVWCWPGTTGVSWVRMLQSHCVLSTPELCQVHLNCWCNGLTSPLACCRWCQWFSFSCDWGWRILHLSQGCHSSMHLQSIDHRFCHILWWCCAALASGNLHPVGPRWPFHLGHCQWRAGNCSGSASDMLCWPAWQMHSHMPTSISVSWWSKYLSTSTDLLVCSMALMSVMVIAPAILILLQLASSQDSWSNSISSKFDTFVDQKLQKKTSPHPK